MTKFLDDDTVATVGIRGQVALHDAQGVLRKSWRVDSEAAEGRVVYSIAVSHEPPALHILTGRRVAISYDRHGKEVLRRSEAQGSETVHLFDGGRLAFGGARAGGDAPNGVRLMLRVLSRDGRRTDTLPGAPLSTSKFCGADTWWCVWSPTDGATVVDHVAGRTEQYVLDLPRSEHPEVLRASRDGGRLCTVRYSPRMREGAASGAADPIRLWSPRARALGHVASTEQLASDARLSPLGRRLAVGWHSGGLVTVHATATQELATGVPRWGAARPYRYLPMVTADGRKMVYFHDGRTVRVLGEDGVEVSRFTFEVPVRNANLEAARGLLLSTGMDGGAWIHDLGGTLLKRLPSKPQILGGLWLGREGAFLTAVRGRIRFHDEHGTVVAEREGHGLGPPPDRAYAGEVAIASANRVRICAPSGDVLREYVPKGDEQPLRYCGSRSGRSLLLLGTGRVRAVCRCLDGEGKEEWSTTVVALGMLAACISQDGSRVVLPASGGLQLRDGAGAELAHLPMAGGITSVAFDAEGARLVASSKAGAVRVWDRNGNWLFDLPSHGEASIAGFSADGRRLATVTNAMARLFTTDVEELDNAEAAIALGIEPGTASKRYIRALTRLRAVVAAARLDAPSV